MEMEDGEARQLAIQKEGKLGQMVGMMAQAEGQNERKKWLYADGLYGERRREYPGYAMVEQMDLALSDAVKVSVREVVRKVVVELMLKWVQLVWLGQQWLEM